MSGRSLQARRATVRWPWRRHLRPPVLLDLATPCGWSVVAPPAVASVPRPPRRTPPLTRQQHAALLRAETAREARENGAYRTLALGIPRR
jgi:hypothetical protein